MAYDIRINGKAGSSDLSWHLKLQLCKSMISDFTSDTQLSKVLGLHAARVETFGVKTCIPSGQPRAVVGGWIRALRLYFCTSWAN